MTVDQGKTWASSTPSFAPMRPGHHLHHTQPRRNPRYASSQLTKEQLSFKLIHDLYTLNVPVTDIAGVMERMRVVGSLRNGPSTFCVGINTDVVPNGPWLLRVEIRTHCALIFCSLLLLFRYDCNIACLEPDKSHYRMPRHQQSREAGATSPIQPS